MKIRHTIIFKHFIFLLFITNFYTTDKSYFVVNFTMNLEHLEFMKMVKDRTHLLTCSNVICSSWLLKIASPQYCHNMWNPFLWVKSISLQLTLLYAPTSKFIVLVNWAVYWNMSWFDSWYEWKKNNIPPNLCMTLSEHMRKHITSSTVI